MKLSSKIKTAVMALTLAVVGAGAVLAPSNYAAAASWQDGMDAAMGDDVPTDLDGTSGVVTQIINGALYVIGVLAVVMVIIGGVQYTTSGGDQAAVTKAKNTILYGIIGLVIAILAYAIVNFVIGKVTG
ncbi:hypothetical protein IK146_01710 [Candidatus Saccharibacteria bacterium]|nr:hypothetical protein [Candidatus Saccharibacteria bacterium]